MLRKLWLKGQLEINTEERANMLTTIASKLRKIVQESVPKNLVETLEKCAQITKFEVQSSQEMKNSED